ncbi:MAG: hypothetical protein KDC26_08185 [Armatimonadetes bacterium]|nr:hypothetical protein [Armatimonadota bacterium]
MRALYWAAVCLGLTVMGCKDTTFKGPVAKYGLDPAVENAPHFDEIDADPNEFSLKIAQAYADHKPGTNQLVNTYGLYLSSLAMLNVAEGDTYKQLADFLGISVFDLDPIDQASNHWLNEIKGSDQVKFGTGIFAIRPLQFDELSVMELANDLGVDTIEFGAAGLTAERAYKQWLSQFGFKKLPKEAFEIPDRTDLMVVTAALFDAEWATPFDPSDTRKAPFNTRKGQVSVDMMEAEVPAITSESEHWTAAELRYKGNRFAFSILMPSDEAQSPESALEETSTEEWMELINGFKTQAEHDVLLPKFEWKGTQDFFNLMDDVGLGGMKEDLNLSRLSLDIKKSKYWVSGWKQYNAITVNEQGTRIESVDQFAAAGDASMPFIVNRPFVYVVRDIRAGLILFVGIVNDPTLTQ